MFSNRISTHVKSRRKHLLVLVYVASSLIWGPAAEASFQLERADGSRPGNGITISGMRTAPREPLGASVGSFLPKPRYEARSEPVALPAPSGNPLPASIVNCESGGSYTAENPTSTASGKYQIVDGTWDGYGGYQHASDAPPHVQDARAAEIWNGGKGSSHWEECL